MSGERVERRLAAIFAADVAGYSRLMGQDEAGTLALLRTHRREFIDPKIAEHKGRIVKTTGDGMLVEFPSVVEAVSCAVEFQRGMAERNSGAAADERIEFRVGINLGDVIVEDGDIFGDGVNVAARLEALAEPGGVCISRTVRDQILDKLPYPFDDLGEQSVRNIARPVRVYALRPDAVANLSASGIPIAATRRRRTAIVVATAVALFALAMAATAWWVSPGKKFSSSSSTSNAPAAGAMSEGLSAPPLSIVVLPFANLSNDPAQQYFADGITEDLTTDLSRIERMRVISRDTAFAYKDKPINTKQIGRELGVRYVLEGSVRRSGNYVRVNAQLIDAETGAHLWADRFDRDIGDLFTLQNEITARIAGALQSQLAIAEARRPINNPDALDYIMRGREILTRPISKENYKEAVRLFETALTLDPQATDAAAWLAIALVVRVTDEVSDSPDADLRRAGQLAAQALAAAPDSALAHYAKAQVLRAQWRCKEAIPEYETALAYDSSRAPAYAHIGWCKFLTGAVDEAIPYFEHAIRLSPYGPGIAPWYGRIGVIQLLEAHTEDAIASLEKAKNANPRLPFVHAYLAAAYALAGQTLRAQTELATARAPDSIYTSLANVMKSRWYDDQKIRALAETTYFEGLRKAGLPER
jgi:TolB-like protein/class 3 adenylate cyclase/tetratricopeptide (TPR) repeat protein